MLTEPNPFLAFLWPGASNPAPYSSHPYPLLQSPLSPPIPIPVTLSPVPSPYTPYSRLPTPYTRQMTPVILHRTRSTGTGTVCATSYTVDPKPEALDPTSLALQSIPHPSTLKPNFKAVNATSCTAASTTSSSLSLSSSLAASCSTTDATTTKTCCPQSIP